MFVSVVVYVVGHIEKVLPDISVQVKISQIVCDQKVFVVIL
jgi:hypothetical protein